MSYKVIRNIHPSHKVNDLDAAEKFLYDIFGCPSIPIRDYLPPIEVAPNYPRNYSILTPLSDVLFDCLDPSRYVVEGRQTYESVPEPHLFCIAFAVDGIEELYQALMANGIRSTDQSNRLGDSEKAPASGFLGSKRPLFFTLPESTGIRYQISSVHGLEKLDRRAAPTWKIPAPESGLGVEFCSYQTILTKNKPRQLRFLVDILHGTVIHESYNKLLDVESTYVWVGDGVYELATPVKEGSFAANDAKGHFDTYHSLTWKVKDLAVAEKFLADHKIRVMFRDESTIIVNPKDAIGIPWGFSVKTIPGDPREARNWAYHENVVAKL